MRIFSPEEDVPKPQELKVKPAVEHKVPEEIKQ